MLDKIYNLLFPTDFVILDMEEDRKMTLILERTFLATSRALIDVELGELIFRVLKKNAKRIFFWNFNTHPSVKTHEEYIRIM